MGQPHRVVILVDILALASHQLTAAAAAAAAAGSFSMSDRNRDLTITHQFVQF
jgi:hypothetical protein